MGVVGEETAPKSAPWHSVRRTSSVRWGSAVPVAWKVPKPAGRDVKVKARVGELRASRMRRAA